MSIQKTCMVTGHRNIPKGKLDWIQSELRREILEAVEAGYTHFISGFSEGCDLIFAGIIAQLQDEGRQITLEAAIPYRNQLNSKNDYFQSLLPRCSIVGVISEHYSKDCFFIRNRQMIWNSSRVIAVYDGREIGETFFTIHYARIMERDLRLIELSLSNDNG